MTLTAVIGNADGHGKNVALLHDADGYIKLAPAYDTVPTMLWPQLRTRLGMSIGGIADVADVSRDALINETRGWHVNPRVAADTVDQTLEQLGSITVEHPELANLVRTNMARIRGQSG